MLDETNKQTLGLMKQLIKEIEEDEDRPCAHFMAMLTGCYLHFRVDLGKRTEGVTREEFFDMCRESLDMGKDLITQHLQTHAN